MTEFIWSADIIADRGPVDEPVLLSADNSATVGPGQYTDAALEAHAVDWVGKQTGLDPEQMTVVSFAWSSLD